MGVGVGVGVAVAGSAGWPGSPEGSPPGRQQDSPADQPGGLWSSPGPQPGPGTGGGVVSRPSGGGLADQCRPRPVAGWELGRPGVATARGSHPDLLGGRWWREQGRRLPMHPASLCVRSDLLRALGGWMALPGSEDTGLLLALNAVAEGWHLGETGLLYRKWSPQLTASALLEPSSSHRQDAFAMIEQRAGAPGAWGVRWPAPPTKA